jgi:hypothetical protein
VIPVIGFLGSGSAEADADRLRAFLQGLSQTGYVEGKNVAIEYRWMQLSHPDRTPALAADLVGRGVAVIVVMGGPDGTRAAKAATATIVFYTGGDPVAFGLVASLARPGGNVTGRLTRLHIGSTSPTGRLRFLAIRTGDCRADGKRRRCSGEAMDFPAIEVFVRQQIAAGAAGSVEAAMAHMRADHTSAEDAGRIAQEAGVKTLVLSHIGPPTVSDAAWQAAAAKYFEGEIIVGHDLAVI